ncbi:MULTISPECIES: MerR family transcriptional regulator [Actinomyces]|uniref:MerR family transcriptional regulator n=1 Tax=Actinomyces respiraculi TaxID=2744574 RepID=A0A7T0PXE8_9ACTO|nr:MULTISPECIES: MerR family transcriptional regulator [Actinomyces]QPL05765.1 MerR family transcriptional regulator [Actinomyces respiraculi]
MRVKEMADLAGTTTRAVRHYHALGLLPVPATRGMQRDYGFEHLARLLRIRWLSESGLSLERIAQILDDEAAHPTRPTRSAEPTPPARPTRSADSPAAPLPSRPEDTTLADLRATRTEIDRRIDELLHQRRRIDQLIAKASSGERLSPLPSSLETFYSDLEQRLTSPGAVRILRNKQHAMTLLAGTGLFPTTTIDLALDDFDTAERDVMADLFERFNALKGLDLRDPRTDDLRRGLTADLWGLLERHKQVSHDLLRTLPGGRFSARLWSTYGLLLRVAYPDPLQQAVVRDLLALMAADPTLIDVLDPTVRQEWLHA